MGLSTTERWAAAAATWPEYFRLLFWPARLSAEWGPDLLPLSTWGDARSWLGLALGAATLAAAVAAWSRDRWVSVGIFWFALAVFPISNLPFGAGALVTERSLYLPSAAVAFLAPPLLALAMRARGDARRLAALGAAAALALAAARTWTRTPTWESTDTVFLAMAKDSPELWMVQWRLGKLLSAAGRTEEALAWYDRAQPKVRYNHTAMSTEQAEMLLWLGRPAEAERLLGRLVEGPSSDVPGAQVMIARASFDQGRYARAVEAARAAVAIGHYDPAFAAIARHVEALSLEALGRPAEALAAARAGALSPAAPSRRPTRWLHYAHLLRTTGDEGAASAALDSARALAPGILPGVPLESITGPGHPLLRDWVRAAGREYPVPAAPIGAGARGL
jgi:tetratricopeptide (TPR) repeat protein